MINSECIECGKSAPGEAWIPGQFCLFGSLFACSRQCGEAWARKNARDGYRPGEPGFDLVEPANHDPGDEDILRGIEMGKRGLIAGRHK